MFYVYTLSREALGEDADFWFKVADGRPPVADWKSKVPLPAKAGTLDLAEKAGKHVGHFSVQIHDGEVVFVAETA